MTEPFIFISAVTAEHRTTRQRIANVLSRHGYRPVWQDIFGTESGDLRQMLREKIDHCQGLIHIAGDAYGAEPPSADADFGRVSYTQFEFCYACRQRIKTWLILPGAACSRDKALDQLDLPHDPAHPDPAGYQAERRALQVAYRDKLRNGEHVRYEPSDDAKLELTIERLHDEFAPLRQGFQRWKTSVLLGLALLSTLVVCMLALQSWTISKGQKVTTARIRAHLVEASESRRTGDIVEAQRASGWEEREHLREAAERAHAGRLARIDDLAASFVELASGTEATTIFKEMTRILKEEGVEPALAYVARHRGAVLTRVDARNAAMLEENRADLTPLLKEAGLRAAKGEDEEARTNYLALLRRESTWPELLHDFSWFLIHQSVRSEYERTFSVAIADARQALDLAQFLDTRPESQRVLGAALDRMAAILLLRGNTGDVEMALKHSTRSLELSEGLLRANPDSALDAQNVSVSLIKLADFLVRRGQPGDAEQALRHYTRSLELREGLLKANRNSAPAIRDVSLSLAKLAGFFARRGQPGDVEQAIKHEARSLEMTEGVWSANRSSADDARAFSLSLTRLANLLVQRGQAGDGEQALKHYTRAVQICESLLRVFPEFPVAARDCAETLGDMAGFLEGRSQPGDGERALGYYTRSLELRESLLRNDPDSTDAARNVSISHNKLAHFLALRGQPVDREQAPQALHPGR
jgi:tetratricopeptide (TPR) repeat protein